jgi:hypothetical protein
MERRAAGARRAPNEVGRGGLASLAGCRRHKKPLHGRANRLTIFINGEAACRTGATAGLPSSARSRCSDRAWIARDTLDSRRVQLIDLVEIITRVPLSNGTAGRASRGTQLRRAGLWRGKAEGGSSSGWQIPSPPAPLPGGEGSRRTLGSHIER